MAARSSNVIDPALGGRAPQSIPPKPELRPEPSTPQLQPLASYPQPPPNPYYGYAAQPPNPQQPQDQPVYQQQYAAPTDQSPAAGGADAHDAKRPRACDACRNLKVKCELAVDRPDLPCKRCAKGAKVCNVSEPTRKRQKKSDTRVAELEKKLEELTSAVQAQGGRIPAAVFASPVQSEGRAAYRAPSGSSSQAYSTPAAYPAQAPEVRQQQLKRRRSNEQPAYPTPPVYQPREDSQSRVNPSTATLEQSWGIDSDVTRYLHHSTPTEFIGRINALIPPHEATVLFDRYNRELAPHLPAVVFPPEVTAEQLYKEKPMLYLAVIAAASWGQVNADVSREVVRETVGAIGDCAIRNGAKSLELVQTAMVIILWYKPPEQTEQSNFYQLIHVAAVMALDIGLGQRFKMRRRGFTGPTKDYAPGMGAKMMPVDSDALDARRAWLGCYYLCASASMVLRRPNLIRWTNYMEECVAELETNPQSAPTDRLFCQHIKLQHICEQIGQQFFMDDASAAKLDINDAQVSYNVKALEHDLADWKKNVPAECRTPGLIFFEHVCSLYAHEIVLHQNHNVDDFRIPFSEDSLKNVNSGTGTLSKTQIAALKACVNAAHGILDTMLSFDYDTITALPMLLYFVRCVYAVVILIKMHVAICMPNSEIGKLFDVDELRVEYYLTGLIAHFTETGRVRSIKPDKILRILNVLREWFEEKHKKGLAGRSNSPSEQASEQPPTQQSSAGPDTTTSQQHPQSGLHMLSHAATQSNAPQHHSASQQVPATPSWQFPNPTPLPFQPNVSDPTAAANYTPFPSIGNPNDPNNQDFGNMSWDLGVQQAMDIALGDMQGLTQGGGLDSWLLGGGIEGLGGFGNFDGGQVGGGAGGY
ncbi:hypothetical protein LTR95_006216 [Oleoguttula sp. CCFEE 5521]